MKIEVSISNEYGHAVYTISEEVDNIFIAKRKRNNKGNNHYYFPEMIFLHKGIDSWNSDYPQNRTLVKELVKHITREMKQLS